ncbi:protein ANKUB1 [Gastrophryne carolinensis]
MKVFVAFEGFCEPFDFLPGQTVKDAKQMIKDFFHIHLTNDKKGSRYVELTFAGARLRDEWILTDAGVTLSSTIKCVVKEEEKPALYVYNAVTQEKVPIMGNTHLLAETVSHLKSLVSLKSGFPVSVFSLKTLDGKEMYDCNILGNYKLDLGATLRLDVWDGWKELLGACVQGHTDSIQQYLSNTEAILRYQLRVALYIAAYFGHLKLAEWLLKKGARADESVGVHPYKEWCCETDHPDMGKCAIHAAAEAGQILLIRAFVARNVLCLECQNPLGETPIKMCIRLGHKDCVLYLVMKMWSLVSFAKISLPMNIYIKVQRWLLMVKKKMRKVAKWTPQFKSHVGDPLVVDGFTETMMTSRGQRSFHQDRWLTINKNYANKSQSLKWHSMIQRGNPPKPSRFPLIQNTAKKEHAVKRKTVNNDAMNNNNNTWKSQISLPPIYSIRNNRPRNLTVPDAALLLNSSIESFSKHHGRTPRQDAIHFLSLASEFKEKPWLQQLNLARTLAKKTVYK